MSGEPQPIDQRIFVPYRGGRGKRLTATSGSSTSAAIPGMGVGQAKAGQRAMFTNGGNVSAFVVMDSSSVVADLDCYELLPGSTQPLGAPFTPNVAVWFAVITEAGTTTVSVVAGDGL